MNRPFASSRFGSVPRHLGTVLVDEDVPGAAAERIMDLVPGVRAWSVRDVEGLKGQPDEEVLRYASYHNMVLVVCDRGYGSLVFEQALPTPSGIVYLRDQPHNAGLIVATQLLAAPWKLSGSFITYRPGRPDKRRAMLIGNIRRQEMLAEIAEHYPNKIIKINGLMKLADDGSL